MNDSAKPDRFRFEPGELKLPELVKSVTAALEELATQSPASLLAAARAAVSPTFWIAAAKSAVELIPKVVDFSVADVLVAAWKTHRKFRKYTDPALFPPGTVSTVPVATHRMTASLEPYLEVFVDNVSQGKIEFQLELDIDVEAGHLRIQDGRIMRLDAGCGQLTGTLKLAKVVLAKHATRRFEWKEGIRFGEHGIAIGRDGPLERTA